HFVNAADGELAQAPLSETGVDAFAHGTSLVDTFAVRAFHSPAPGGHAGPVFGARRIGIGLMLALRGRSVDEDALLIGPLGIVVLVEAAVDQLAPWQAPVAPAQPLQHRPQQTAVRT